MAPIRDIIEALSNSNFTLFENFVVWMSAFGASFAAYHTRKAYRKGLYGMRNVFKLVHGLAILYVFSYLILLILDVNFLAWSSLMRGVSIFAWFIAWAGPAIVSVKQYDRAIEDVNRLQDQLTELIEENSHVRPD